MDLDKIKNVWQEQKTASFSQKQILSMLKKKSSSTAKWIFYIGLLELLFWLLINLFSRNEEIDSDMFSDSSNLLLDTANILSLSLLFVFIVLFFIFYKNIKAEQPINKLLKNIFKLRRTVEYYIVFNISLFILTFTVFLLMIVTDPTLSNTFFQNIEVNTYFWISLSIAYIITLLLLIVAFYFFYKLLYGILLKRLKKNYYEIKNLENS